ncbi:MAG: STAS domain-containing protein [Pseudomonadota bacterium]
MKIDVSETGGCVIVRLGERRLDHEISAKFRDTVLERARSLQHVLVLDLSAVEFIDSSGLGAIIGLRKRLGWSIRIVLAGLRSPVYRVFELATVTSIFTFYTSVEAALGHMGVAPNADAAPPQEPNRASGD